MPSLLADLQLNFRQIMFRVGCSQAWAKGEVAVVKSCGASVRSGINGAKLDWSRPVEGSLSGTLRWPGRSGSFLRARDLMDQANRMTPKHYESMILCHGFNTVNTVSF